MLSEESSKDFLNLNLYPKFNDNIKNMMVFRYFFVIYSNKS